MSRANQCAEIHKELVTVYSPRKGIKARWRWPKKPAAIQRKFRSAAARVNE
jgi:hypothetical protein